MRVQERDLARRLRREGHSYSEIRSLIPVGKSTLTGWLKDIELTPAQRQGILAKELQGRRRAQIAAAWRNREINAERVSRFIETARRNFTLKATDPLFITGVVLYWAEGAKTTRAFHFMNSDAKGWQLALLERFGIESPSAGS